MNRRDFMAVAGAAFAAPSLPAMVPPTIDPDTPFVLITQDMTREELRERYPDAVIPDKIWTGDLLRIEHADGSWSDHVATDTIEQSDVIDLQVAFFPAIWTPVPGSRYGHPTHTILFSDAVKARDAYSAEMRRLNLTPGDVARMIFPENW